MAQHGPDLFSSDIGITMRDEYKKLSYFGLNHQDILAVFKKYFLGSKTSKNDYNLFWLIMARIQVNYGVLVDEVKIEALKVIDSKEDIKQWETYVNIEKQLFSYTSITQEFINQIETLNQKSENYSDTYIVNIFDQIELQNQKQVENNEDLPDEVRNYYQNKDFSKIMIFGLDGKKYYKKRVQIIEKLKNDIEHYQCKPKKMTIKIDFNPKWKIGDVYTIQVHKNENSFYKNRIINEIGKYIVFEVVGINRNPISEILPDLGYNTDIFIQPFVYLDNKMPNLEEIPLLEYLPKTYRNLFSLVTNNSDYPKQKPQIFQLSFYNTARIFKKMSLIKLKEGLKEFSDHPISTTGTLLVFANDFHEQLAFEIKRYLESIDLDKAT